MPSRQVDIYGGKSPEDVPSYGISQAAHYLRLPPATIRSWTVGRSYPRGSGKATFDPLVSIADPDGRLLSFRNLAELHVLSAIRQKHKVKLQAVRKAIDFLSVRFGSRHPLLHEGMLTDGKHLFIEKYGNVLNISQDGQLEIKAIIDIYLDRIDRSPLGVPLRLFPITRPDYRESPKIVSIDPRVRYGRPCIGSTGIPTTIIAERFEAGDPILLLAEDYGRERAEIEEAVRYESRIAS